MKVCHLTSAHPQEDIRIFHKECVSLAAAGYETYEIACGESCKKSGVQIIGVGKQKSNRLIRMLRSARAVYRASVALDADVYHFHDPELLPYGLKLKRKGKKVIFDSHEDVPAQILDKAWIPKLLRKPVSNAYRAYETHVVAQLDAVVTATSHIAEGFQGRCRRIAVVNNYPKLDDIVFHETPFSERDAIACYAGGIDELRGETIMIDAMRDLPGKLLIAGDHAPETRGETVQYTGRLDRDGINALYGKAVVGLCLLKPIKNYYDSKPIKVYEYMAAGLPYLCSDFPAWRKVAEESGAGICVDPLNREAVAAALRILLTDREAGQTMGRQGRAYILEHCNWANEEKTLLALYAELRDAP